MNQQKRTEISTVGEFGLIDLLTKDIQLKNQSSLKGVGDDCAVLDYRDKLTLVTSDILMEGVHFDLTYTPLKHLGYKAAMVNMSDVYAMNGMPRQIGLPSAPCRHSRRRHKLVHDRSCHQHYLHRRR